MVLEWKIETVKTLFSRTIRFEFSNNSKFFANVFFSGLLALVIIFFILKYLRMIQKLTQAEVPDRSKYVQTVPDKKCLCPDRPRKVVPVSSPDSRALARRSCVYVQNFVRLPDFRAFMSRLLCIYPTFVRSTNFRACMSRLSSVQQTFVRSHPDFRALPRFFAFTGFLLVHDFCAFIKLGCDDVIFVSSSSDMKNLFKSNTIGVGDFRCS